MIKRKYANMRIYDYNIDFEDVENTITYSLSAKNLENNLNKREEKLCDKITDLEAKLAESERKNFELLTKLNLKEYAPAFCTLADRDCEALGQIERLKQQLAEKDAEIRVVYSFRKQKCDNLQKALAEKERQVKKLNLEAQKYFEDAYCNDFHNQDKISFCIEKFQETKKSLRDKVFLMGNDTHYYLQNAILWQDVVAIIDNQIASLKKGVE